MADVGGASPGPALTPVEARGRGPSRWVALGLLTAALVALVGISLVGQSGDQSGPQAAGGGPHAPRPAATPAATPSPTAPPAPPPGTPPPRVAVAVGPAPTCPPGSTPDTPGPADQARPPRDAPTALAFDRRAGRLVALAGTDDRVETWTFDVCTNTWTRMHPNREPPPGTGQLVYDVDSDVTIASDVNPDVGLRPRGRHLDGEGLRSGRSESRAPVLRPGLGPRRRHGDDGDPDTLGLELWSYEVETDTWTPIRQANRLAVEPREFAYDASVDRIVAYSDAGERPGGARTWLFDLRTGTWSGTGAVTPAFSYGWFGDRARHRLRRGGGADRDDRPGPIGRLRRGRGPLGDPVRDALRGRAGRVWHPPGVPLGAPDRLRRGERAARHLRWHVLHDVHVGGGGRHVGVRHGDPLVDARRAPDPGAASPAGPGVGGRRPRRTRTGRPGSAPRR